jgi:hypothetical protein
MYYLNKLEIVKEWYQPLNSVNLGCPDFVFYFIFISSFYYCEGWSNIVAFTQDLKIYRHEFTSSTVFPSYPTPLIPRVVSTGITFVFTYICTHFIILYSPSYPFPQHLPSPTGANTPPWAGLVLPSCSLIS